MTAAVPDWDGLAAALSDVLATMPADGVIALHEAADPEEGRYAHLWRRAEALLDDVVPVDAGLAMSVVNEWRRLAAGLCRPPRRHRRGSAG